MYFLNPLTFQRELGLPCGWYPMVTINSSQGVFLTNVLSYHTYNGTVFSLIDVGSVTSPGVSKVVFEISLQFEGSARPHRMVELYGNWLSWSIKLEGWCTMALIMLWTILAAVGHLCRASLDRRTSSLHA